MQDAIEQLMNANKTTDTRESSVTSKNDLDESQQNNADNNRRNASGYSWWKWRRSTESADKKSPPKEIQDSKDSRQSVDDMKEIMNDLDNMTISGSTATESKAVDDNIEGLETSLQNLSMGNNDTIAKNDDSISSELADVSKSSFSSEKYRKTLRLTSEQIVSSYNFIESMFSCD